MAVPITQIPNAPNAIAGAAPLPNTPIPGNSPLYDAPRLNSPNFSRAISVLGQTSRLLDAPAPKPVEFIDYVNQAWSDFGATGAKVAGNLMDFATQMQRTRDEGNLAKIDNALAQSYGDFVTWSQDKQPDELLPEWERRRDSVLKSFKDLPFSENGRAKAGVLVDNKMVQYGVDVATTARKQAIKSADSELVAARDRAIAMGDYESGFAYQAKRHGLGFVSRGDNERELLGMEKKQQSDALENMVTQDPFNTYDTLTNVMASSPDGRWDQFPLLDGYAISRQRDMARSKKLEIQRDTITQISDYALKNPQGIDSEQIQRMGEMARLPQENIESLKNNWKVAYAATPEGQAAFTKAQNDLYFQIRKFEPQIDNSTGELTDKSFAEYLALDASIRNNMPPGHVERFTEPLKRNIDKARKKSEGKTDGPQNIIRKQLLDQVALMRKHKGLGDDGGTNREGKPLDYQRFLQVEQRQAELSDAVENIFRQNPDITVPEAVNQFKDLFNNKFNDIPAAEFLKPNDDRSILRKIGDWLGAAASPVGNNPNVMAAGIVFGDFGTPAPAGSKVTSYNFKGDSYGDSLSRADIGAFTKNLGPDSLAISPDVEKAFRDAGIKPNDRVVLTLGDGTEITRVWDDRTMQDEQAKRKFGKPLRGRFDFNHPYEGPHPLTDMKVVRFRKA